MRFALHSLLSTILVVIFALPATTFALDLPVLDLVTMKSSPNTPGPNSPVAITLQSYAVNLGLSHIIWSINDEPYKEGYGLTEIQTQTKGFGEKVNIVADIFTREGQHYQKTLLLEPAEVDLLWEAKTYTPPFYKGKALPTYQSDVHVVALPRFGVGISNPETYYYSWKMDRTKLVGEGLGHDSALIRTGHAGEKTRVGVSVKAMSGGGEGNRDIEIVSGSPLVRFYEEAPLLGTRYEEALSGAVSFPGSDVALRAVPYYFSLDDYRAKLLKFSWMKNYSRSRENSDSEVINVSTNDDQLSSTSYLLKIANKNRLLQNAQSEITVLLGKN